ncbi:MAG: DotU family type IV/VI secretion system protein [Myxococcales bacterium]
MDRVNEITKDCFNALFQLRHLDDSSLPPAEALHHRLRGFVDELFQRAAQEGFSREDVNDIAYAIVALFDEVALSKSESFREYWLPNLLQLHYFHENVAGVAFFTRLESIRKDPRRADVLRVYWLALAFGFRGKHAVRGGELELYNLTETIHREISRGRRFESDVLSPRGERPPDTLALSGRSGRMLWISAAAAAAVLTLYAGLRIGIATSASSIVERIAAASPP